MQRYLIIILSLLFTIVIFYTIMILLRKLKINNRTNLSIIISIITFILTLVFSFLYFETHNNINLKYTPPKVINGKIQSGKFD